MSGRERDDHGQFQSEFTDSEIIEAISKNEPAATLEIAQAVGYSSRSAAQYRLEKLEAAGRVRSKKVGRELVWMVAQ
jgi:predicted transcriptional regulator